VVDRNAAELVDQYGRRHHPRLAKQSVGHSRLAGAEKAAEQGDRNPAFNVP